MSGLQLVYPAVTLVCKELTDGELAALNLAVTADFDPRNVSGYDKVSSLFTESDGTRMHDVTKAAFTLVVQKILL